MNNIQLKLKLEEQKYVMDDKPFKSEMDSRK